VAAVQRHGLTPRHQHHNHSLYRLTIGWLMDTKWKRWGKKRPWNNLLHYCSICLVWLKKSTKNLIQENRSQVRDLKAGHPQYEQDWKPSTSAFGEFPVSQPTFKNRLFSGHHCDESIEFFAVKPACGKSCCIMWFTTQPFPHTSKLVTLLTCHVFFCRNSTKKTGVTVMVMSVKQTISIVLVHLSII
jgi:hypothetical protein